MSTVQIEYFNFFFYLFIFYFIKKTDLLYTVILYLG